jgi:PAS domain S-box-containing protein
MSDFDVHSMVHQTLLGDAWENARVAAAVFSDDGRYIACNTAFCSLSGYTRDELMAMRVGVDLAPEGSKENLDLFRGITSGTLRAGSGRLRRKDGVVLDVDVLASATFVASLPYYIVLYWERADRPSWPDG